MWKLVAGIGGLAAICFFWNAPDVNADTGVQPLPIIPGIGSPGGGLGDVGGLGSPGGVNFAPGNAALFMCPGIGGSAAVLGFGGGYCDFNFQPVKLDLKHWGVMHSHCEWGGAAPLVQMWNCWRVWPGQPDHPALPDPDVIPDGMGVPWAIQGPVPSDQWPPPGLAPFPDLLNQPVGPLPGPPPGPPEIPFPNPQGTAESP
jgi:hypothetical protein